MMKTTILAIAACAATALLAFDAGALPVAPPSEQASSESGLLLVRDGCGRGMRYSNSRGRCVEEGGPPAVVIVPGREIRGRCGPGWRYSNSRGRCVRD